MTIQNHTLSDMEQKEQVIIFDSELHVLIYDYHKSTIQMRDKYDYRFQSVIKRKIDETIFTEGGT